jgi:ADP-heptose:LPS heptosyltransferase
VSGRSFFFRRQFYPQLVRIALDGLRRHDRRGRVFVSMMGGIGDLVNAFPAIAHLARAHRVDMGTGADPYRALVRANPCVSRVYSPFVFKPIRRAHRRIITRTLAPFYERVILLDEPDSAWRACTAHMSVVYATRCGTPVPARGLVYLPEEARARAARWLDERGLEDFIYVVHVVRRRRPERSWPPAHYARLYALLRERFPARPIVAHTVGSDDRTVPAFCTEVAAADILTVGAFVERARLYVGPDTGPTHVAAALGVPTVSIHLGVRPEISRALGDNVALLAPGNAGAPAGVTPEQVVAAAARQLRETGPRCAADL